MFRSIVNSIVDTEYQGDGLYSRDAIGSIQRLLVQALSDNGNMDALEDTLSSIASLGSALLIQSWRTNTSNIPWEISWRPLFVNASGWYPVVEACLQVNGPQTVIGSFCVLLLIVASAISIGRPQRLASCGDLPRRDGSIIDITSLLSGSCLPLAVATGTEEGYDDSRRWRATNIVIR